MKDYNYILGHLHKYCKQETRALRKRIKARLKTNEFKSALVLQHAEHRAWAALNYISDYIHLPQISAMQSNYQDDGNEETGYGKAEPDQQDDSDILLEWMIEDFRDYLPHDWETEIHQIIGEHELVEIENIKNATMLCIAASWYLSAVYHTPKEHSRELMHSVGRLQNLASATMAGLLAQLCHAIVTLKHITEEDADNASSINGRVITTPEDILKTINIGPSKELGRFQDLENDLRVFTDVAWILLLHDNILELCGAFSWAMGDLVQYDDFDSREEEGLLYETKEELQDSFGYFFAKTKRKARQGERR